MDCSLRTQFNSLAWSWSLTIHLCVPYLSKLTPVFSITLPHWHAHHILFSQLTCLFTCLRNHQGLSHHLAFPLLFPQPWMAPFPVPSLHANALPPSQPSLGVQQPIFREATWETAAPPGWPGGHIHWGRCRVRKGCISQMRKGKFHPERGMCVQGHAVVVLDDARASEAGVLWSWVSCHREFQEGLPICISTHSCDPLGLSSHGVLILSSAGAAWTVHPESASPHAYTVLIFITPWPLESPRKACEQQRSHSWLRYIQSILGPLTY